MSESLVRKADRLLEANQAPLDKLEAEIRQAVFEHNSLKAERDRLRASNAELLAALEGVRSHNEALKDRYMLPESLMRVVNAAIAKAKQS